VKLAESAAARGWELIYGGGNVGLMGELARAGRAHGAEVTGVITRQIHERVPAAALTRLEVVGSMHERKARMHDLSDAFIALPGGIGTFEEWFEALAWSYLGLHDKPCALLNALGYYDRMLEFLEHSVEQGFIPEAVLSGVVVEHEPEPLLERLAAFRPERVAARWQRDDLLGR
jgi:uncharacterized protein (TIGR00730 family)